MTAARILIVEDERIVAEDLRLTLIQMGYDVTGSVATGEEAVTLVREHSPDLILMDIFLAGKMDGITATGEIRKFSAVPVIYLTAFADKTIMDKAKITEPYGYILKPYQERELHTIIEISLYKYQIDQQLRESEEKLRQMNEILEVRVRERTADLDHQVHFLQQLIDTIPSPVYYKDTDLRYLGCNRTFEGYLGVSRDAIIGKTVTDFAPGDLATLTMNKDRYLLSHHGVQVYQMKYPHHDGSLRDLIVKKATFSDDSGKALGIIGVWMDISDRVRAEEALVESEKRFRAVVQDQSELIYRFRVDRRILFANKAFLDYFALDEQKTVGYIFRLPVFPDDQHAVDAHFASLAPDHPLGLIEYRCTRSDGTIAWQQWSNRAFFDTAGNVTEYQSVGRDITRKKEIEEQQRRAYHQIEQNLQQFAILNDHIRNPLAVIMMLAGIREDDESRKIIEKSREIDDILGKLHQGYLESEKVRMFLRTHYDIEG